MYRPDPKPPQPHAVALAYQAGDSAPRVVAKGRGLIAQKIIERANENGVFVHQSKELVALLMQVELDRDIPPTCTGRLQNSWRGYIISKRPKKTARKLRRHRMYKLQLPMAHWRMACKLALGAGNQEFPLIYSLSNLRA